MLTLAGPGTMVLSPVPNVYRIRNECSLHLRASRDLRKLPLLPDVQHFPGSKSAVRKDHSFPGAATAVSTGYSESDGDALSQQSGVRGREGYLHHAVRIGIVRRYPHGNNATILFRGTRPAFHGGKAALPIVGCADVVRVFPGGEDRTRSGASAFRSFQREAHYRILEDRATASLRQGDVMIARIVPFLDGWMITSETILRFPANTTLPPLTQTYGTVADQLRFTRAYHQSRKQRGTA